MDTKLQTGKLGRLQTSGERNERETFTRTLVHLVTPLGEEAYLLPLIKVLPKSSFPLEDLKSKISFLHPNENWKGGGWKCRRISQPSISVSSKYKESCIDLALVAVEKEIAKLMGSSSHPNWNIICFTLQNRERICKS